MTASYPKNIPKHSSQQSFFYIYLGIMCLNDRKQRTVHTPAPMCSGPLMSRKDWGSPHVGQLFISLFFSKERPSQGWSQRREGEECLGEMVLQPWPRQSPMPVGALVTAKHQASLVGGMVLVFPGRKRLCVCTVLCSTRSISISGNFGSLVGALVLVGH